MSIADGPPNLRHFRQRHWWCPTTFDGLHKFLGHTGAPWRHTFLLMIPFMIFSQLSPTVGLTLTEETRRVNHLTTTFSAVLGAVKAYRLIFAISIFIIVANGMLSRTEWGNKYLTHGKNVLPISAFSIFYIHWKEDSEQHQTIAARYLVWVDDGFGKSILLAITLTKVPFQADDAGQVPYLTKAYRIFF